MNNTVDTRKLYNKQSDVWARREPRSLSDFTGRPVVFNMLGDLRGLKVLDLGCGEGYPARVIKSMGADSVTGIDISDEMIARAREEESTRPLGIEYFQGDIRELKIESETYDVVAAVFVFNYLKINEMHEVMVEVERILKPGGRFVFSVPHPAFSLIWEGKAPFHFQFEGGYFSSRDQQFQGEIYTIDGVPLKVQKYHKTFEDYFSALNDAGFKRLPKIKECSVTNEMIEKNPSFFAPIKDTPLHVVFAIEK